ncbi:MAG: hypothetical protein KGN76_18445 [Acidobacteriota bacterium]|nr:hypothetical protein [Acidobacteriota bacterium]
MKTLWILLAAVGLSAGLSAQNKAPLTLVQTFPLPATVKGPIGRLGVDVAGHRLFLPAEDAHAVLVLDLRTGALLHTIGDPGGPRAVLFRADLGSLYIVDGRTGEVKVYDAGSYREVMSTRRTLGAAVPVMPDARDLGYDPRTKLLYVTSAGAESDAKGKAARDKKKTSLLNMVDTSTGYKGSDLEIDGDALGAMALETKGPLLYLNNPAKHEIDVIDRVNMVLKAKWPVTMGQDNRAMALDEASHRLFVGCASGAVVVFDTKTGTEIKALPIPAGIDDLAFDPQTRRLYACCGGDTGTIDVYQEKDGDQFQSLGRVASGPDAGSALLVPELHRYFVSVPAHGNEPGKVLVYQVP